MLRDARVDVLKLVVVSVSGMVVSCFDLFIQELFSHSSDFPPELSHAKPVSFHHAIIAGVVCLT